MNPPPGPVRPWLLAATLLCAATVVLAGEYPLPSWNDGVPKQAILKFVADATRPDAATFVPPAERIATFDNDGTLWAEQPIYFQFAFVFDRVKALAPSPRSGTRSSPSGRCSRET